MKPLLMMFLASSAIRAASGALCVCPPEAVDPMWAAGRAAIVFVGRVERTTSDRRVVNSIGQVQSQYGASFVVERQWQGSAVENIDVITVRATSCFPTFAVGKRYVVFAFAGDPGSSPYEAAGSFYARRCYPSGEASTSVQTIRLLDEWVRGQK